MIRNLILLALFIPTIGYTEKKALFSQEILEKDLTSLQKKGVGKIKEIVNGKRWKVVQINQFDELSSEVEVDLFGEKMITFKKRESNRGKHWKGEKAGVNYLTLNVEGGKIGRGSIWSTFGYFEIFPLSEDRYLIIEPETDFKCEVAEK